VGRGAAGSGAGLAAAGVVTRGASGAAGCTVTVCVELLFESKNQTMPATTTTMSAHSQTPPKERAFCFLSRSHAMHVPSGRRARPCVLQARARALLVSFQVGVRCLGAWLGWLVPAGACAPLSGVRGASDE
jgi:hypothetical protein